MYLWMAVNVTTWTRLVILGTTAWLIYSKYMQTKTRSPLITMFYRDGLIYFVLMFSESHISTLKAGKLS